MRFACPPADDDNDERRRKKRRTMNDVKQNKNSPVERVVVLVLSLRVVKCVAVGPVCEEWVGEREQDKGRGG